MPWFMFGFFMVVWLWIGISLKKKGHSDGFKFGFIGALFLTLPVMWITTSIFGKPEQSVSATPPQNEPQQTVPTQAKPTLNFASLGEAVAAIKPLMGDEINDVSAGAVALAMWSDSNLNWSDFKNMSQSKYALIMKDSDTERGKLLCAVGSIIEIQSEKLDGHKFYMGGIADDYGRIYRFIAVHSTGDLVAQSEGKFCGVVIGKQSYSNSIGGVAHAVFLVGMFALPENKKDIRPISGSL